MIAVLTLSGAILVIGCALMVVLVMLWANRSLHELDREIEAGM